MNKDDSILNLFTGIMLEPRATIQQIVEAHPDRFVVGIVALAGIGESLNRASLQKAGDTFDLMSIGLIVLIGGPLGAILSLYLSGELLRWTGGKLGGHASSRHIRTAIAWSLVPLLCALLLWIPKLIGFGGDMFMSSQSSGDTISSTELIFVGFEVMNVFFKAWAFTLFLKCLSQLQGFSMMRSFGSAVLAWAVIIVPLVLFGLCVAGVMIGFMMNA